MMIIRRYRLALVSLILCAVFHPDRACAELDKFMPAQGGSVEIWRITDNPSTRDWANYQNTDAWSPDGRYACYVSKQGSSDSHVMLHDFSEDKDITIDPGIQPRWANNNNWLFYLRRVSGKKELELIRYDCDSGRKTHLSRKCRNSANR